MSGPLEGRVVLVTRPSSAVGEVADRLRALGAEAIEAPTIVVEPAAPGGPLDAAIREAGGGAFEWVVFTSGAGVRAWFDRAAALGLDGRVRARVAVVGEATAEALRQRGVEPDLVPREFTTAALGEAFPRGAGEVLLARADLATGDVEEVLRRRGWSAVRVDAYRVRPADDLPEAATAALRGGLVDAVTFTSPSTVQGFVRLAGVVAGPAVVCIGPVTADAARRAGFAVATVASPHSTAGLVEAVVEALG